MTQNPEPIRKQKGMNIADKTVLITGANRGIGRALAGEALKRGAKRVYAGTRVPLQAIHERLTPVTLDVTNPSQINRAVDEIDTLDVLINNAGIATYEDLSDLRVIEEHLAVNLLGLLKVTNAFLPLLRRSGGAIVNNLSLVALAPLPVIPAYSLSKAAALNATQSMRALLAGQGVTVHAVILGPIDTDMNRGLRYRRHRPNPRRSASSIAWKKGTMKFSPTPRLCRSPKAGGAASRRGLSTSSPLSRRTPRRALVEAANPRKQEPTWKTPESLTPDTWRFWKPSAISARGCTGTVPA